MNRAGPGAPIVKCSTPNGINARITSGIPRLLMARDDVLNA